MKKISPDYLFPFLLILLFFIPAGSLTVYAQDLSECSKIEDDKERLKCYDEITDSKTWSAHAGESISEKPASESEKFSYLTNLWELDKEKPRNTYAIRSHRSNYILPFSYNFNPNKEPLQQAFPGRDVLKPEVKFQISLKIKLWQDVLGQNMDLWFGYTQQSYWQLYNFADSSPFRETNYEPELLLNFRTDFDFLGMKGKMVTLGFNHQSNGQSKPLSRSWNRIVGNIGFEKDNLVLLLKTWYRINEDAATDDNPDIDKYMGYGEIWGYYFWKKNRFGVMVRNNLRLDGNKGTLQLEWSLPLTERISGYVQYFTGYGESLLDYNHSVNRIGLGVIVADWN